MSWLETLVLALIQGITEFLPVSSSAHLLLPKLLFAWQDQGLALDVALHLGTLSAVVLYLRRDLFLLAHGLWRWLTGRGINAESRVVGWLVLATLPLLPAGLFLAPRMGSFRVSGVIATTTILFGILLWFADRRTAERQISDLRWFEVVFIGLAQACALVPGTSRSGVTMTAALFLGLDRVAAARFSFLLAIPAIAASAVHQALELNLSAAPVPWVRLAVGALTAAIVAVLVMHALLAWLRRAGMTPFVIYRITLGALLFFLLYVG